MTEDDLLRALPLADRLADRGVDLAVTGAPRALIEALWRAALKWEDLGGSNRRLHPAWLPYESATFIEGGRESKSYV